MGKRGPKPQYDKSAETLKNGIDQYFTECEEKGVFPDYAGMCIWLEIPKKKMEQLSESGEAFREVLDYAMARRESYLARVMAGDNKRAQGCMNNLKQPINGGYIDRPTENRNAEIKISLVGVGGESAFK